MGILTFRFNLRTQYVFSYGLTDGRDWFLAPVFRITRSLAYEDQTLMSEPPLTTEPSSDVRSPFTDWPCTDCRQLSFQGILQYDNPKITEEVWDEFPNHPDFFELQTGGRHRIDFEGYAKTIWGHESYITLHFDYEVIVRGNQVSWIMYENPPNDKRIRYGVGTRERPTWWCWISSSNTFEVVGKTKIIYSNNSQTPVPNVSIWDIPFVSDRVVNDIKTRLETSSLTRSKFDWGQLCGRAAESARGFTGNGVALAKERIDMLKAAVSFFNGNALQGISDTKSLIRSLVRKASKARTIDERAKHLASAYLSIHYGAKLTIADESDMDEFVRHLSERQFYQRLGSVVQADLNWSAMPNQIGDLSVSRRVTSIIRSYSDDILHVVDSVSDAQNQLLQRIKRSGYEYDLLPSLENIWDLIPFSFVVDWFLPIGAQLGKMESRGYVETLPVIVCFYTDKWLWKATAPSYEGWQSIDSINYCFYERTCSDRMIPPCLVSPESPITRLPTHWVEGLAVAIQQL